MYGHGQLQADCRGHARAELPLSREHTTSLPCAPATLPWLQYMISLGL